jgi:hypothetical protein
MTMPSTISAVSRKFAWSFGQALNSLGYVV